MFESTEQVLTLFGQFMAIGFALGLVYNVFAFFRLLLKEIRLVGAVTDLLFPFIAGFTLFAFSVELGTGFFRLYYVAAAALGFGIYAVTLGLLTPLPARLIRKLAALMSAPVKKLFCFIQQKLSSLFGVIYQKVSKILLKGKISLQNTSGMLYNNRVSKIGKMSEEKGGENRYAIKARVRKIP